MQVDSIISNAITQDIRLKGHQSIRFAPDGFSVLVSDAGYRPVFLKQFIYESSVPVNLYPGDCVRILDELELLTFGGETVFIVDSMAATVVPAQFFNEQDGQSLLEKAATLLEADQVHNRLLKDRDMHLVYAVPKEIQALKSQFSGDVRIIHTDECLVSLSDQVQASDHQRGVVLVEVQQYTMDILVILEDGIKLLNRYALKDPSDFIYHTLNTFKQLKLDRETIPAYLSGIVHGEHELFGLLGKYIRHVKTTPYYLEELSRAQMLRFMILSEGSKCA
ncbi:MAG: DUF3822 family protein [Bacteroidales bacterium]|nr:DUF3822 family protein [Bacteroidales bacterium]